MPKAYSYIRMSTDTQLKGDSLRRQVEMSERYAVDHGLELQGDFALTDIGVSAFKGDNIAVGALGKFLERVRDGDVEAGSYLLVESLDRLSRQKITPSLQLLLELSSNGINVVTLQDQQVYPAGEIELPSLMMSLVIMSRAYEESQTKSRRVGAAWKNKRDNAAAVKLSKICPAWLSLSDDRLSFIVHDERAAVIQRIFDDTERGFGTFALTRMLNRERVPAFGRSNGWVQSYVKKILENRAVIGEYQPHTKTNGKRIPTGDPISGYFPAIITETQFYATQQIRRAKGNAAGGRRGPTQRNLFTNLAKCGYCGGSMTLINKGAGPKGGIYLSCSTARSGIACVSTGWRYEDFERSFLFFAKEVDLRSVLDAAQRRTDSQKLEAEVRSVDEQLRLAKLKRDRIFSLLGDETQDMAFLSRQLADASDGVRKLDARLAGLHAERTASSEPGTSPEQLVADIDRLQSLEGTDALKHRTQLAARLKTIIQSLRLEVEGSAPRRKAVAALLECSNISAEDAEGVLQERDRVSELAGSNSPTFTVVFADAAQRLVRVVKGKPLSLNAEVVVDADGGPTLEHRGGMELEAAECVL